MVASQCKTQSSAFVITAVIAVFYGAVTSPALAQTGSQGTKNAASHPSTTSQRSAVAAMSVDHQYRLLVVIVALAAFIRARIEWSKKLIRRTPRCVVIPMLFVEFGMAAAGFMLVYLMFSDSHLWAIPVDFEGAIRLTFMWSVVGLAGLLVWQWWFDFRWMCNGTSVLSGFLFVKAIDGDGKTVRTMIRVADVLRLDRRSGAKATITLRNGDKITFNKPRLL